ncbi:ubiquitin binding protein [Thelephora ganbajun]|uniref:Ubiquitin binding protein n=1 Tax=Thelephora ganbajun TaxID=370292 RepID=A0ACB6Z5Z4_THEGA|nr:ubiquitin binding protein [Thelephora ganbajun]
MTSLGTWLWGTSQLDDAIDKATSELLPAGSEDMALSLEICDQIRSKSVSSKDAMRSLRRRLDHKNPNVQLSALSLVDLCVKNGGDHFLTEISSKEFMDNLVSILKFPALNSQVKVKILRLVQNWASAFEGKPTLGYVSQVYRTLKSEGFSFPPQDPASTSSAMVDTQTAPDWIDSDVCMRCRTQFTFTNRKHHCRNCGQVFDHQCSSKSLPLPHFGIVQEVRVCDSCFVKLTRAKDKSFDVLKTSYHPSNTHGSRSKVVRDADTDLQRAIQLSLEEAGICGALTRSGYTPSQPPSTNVPTKTPTSSGFDDDPDLKAAIEASLQDVSNPMPSAPLSVDLPQPVISPLHQANARQASRSADPLSSLPNYNMDLRESDAIMTFTQTVEQAQHDPNGRDISRYPTLNQLYDQANGLRPKLAMSLDDTSRRENLLTEMHDKLSQAVKLYDQLLSAQVAHPPRRNIATTGSTYPSALRQVPDTWMSPPPASSPTWVSPQTQPVAHAQIRPPSPRVSRTPSFITSVSHPTGYYPASLPQVVDSQILQTAPKQVHTLMPTSSHPPPPPVELGVNPAGNFHTFSPPRQGATNIDPSPLPSFPIAPTLAPQSSYMPSVPQSVIQQPDRQETLLIDL